MAPFFLLLLVLRHIDAGGGAFIHNIVIESLAYAIAWLLFPLVMASVTRMLDCADKYIDFVVAYNWCGAIQNGVYLPIAILGYTGALAPGLANTLALTVILWVVVYTFFVARTTLQVTPATAFAIVVLDFVIGILLDGFTNRFV